nr:immunoglobulin heavy chain junction region [Mus musculus]NSM07246.1 immunoglobulin heavy chain junction region [Mus musculus]
CARRSNFLYAMDYW